MALLRFYSSTVVNCCLPQTDEERIMEVALEAGGEDVISNEDGSIEGLRRLTNLSR